jgi:hypothetical protein
MNTGVYLRCKNEAGGLWHGLREQEGILRSGSTEDSALGMVTVHTSIFSGDKIPCDSSSEGGHAWETFMVPSAHFLEFPHIFQSLHSLEQKSLQISSLYTHMSILWRNSVHMILRHTELTIRSNMMSAVTQRDMLCITKHMCLHAELSGVTQCLVIWCLLPMQNSAYLPSEPEDEIYLPFISSPDLSFSS